MKKIILSLACTFALCQAFAGYTVKIKVDGLPNSLVLLTDFKGHVNKIVDSTMTNARGEAVFNFPDNQRVGMYKIVLDNNNYIDFIFNKENIELSTASSDPQGNLKVVNSKENKFFFKYLETKEKFKNKLEILQQLHDRYPKGEPFLHATKAEYNKQRTKLTLFEDSMLSASKGTYAARVIRLLSERYENIDSDGYQRFVSQRSHWLDKVDFNDTLLIYSNSLTGKLIDYLSLYTSKQYNPETQTFLLKAAVDTLLLKSKTNKQMSEFVVGFLIDGFEQVGDSKLVEHVASRYNSVNTCEHEGEKTTLERKILTNTKLKDGANAPFFALQAEDGSKVTLDDYANRTVILVFWATWCPHCLEALPKIKEMYDKRRDKTVEVLTISLDTNKVQWKNYIAKNNITFTKNFCDGKSWDGEMASNFYIYSSPSIFVLKNKRIIAKPIDPAVIERTFNGM